MRAVVIEAFGQVPRIVDVPDPAPPAHGVVVAVEATGVCRSDWHAWQGHDPDITLPHVPGHELAGTVVAVGGAAPLTCDPLIVDTSLPAVHDDRGPAAGVPTTAQRR